MENADGNYLISQTVTNVKIFKVFQFVGLFLTQKLDVFS